MSPTGPGYCFRCRRNILRSASRSPFWNVGNQNVLERQLSSICDVVDISNSVPYTDRRRELAILNYSDAGIALLNGYRLLADKIVERDLECTRPRWSPLYISLCRIIEASHRAALCVQCLPLVARQIQLSRKRHSNSHAASIGP